MKTIAFFNNKGGVGKTTLVYHIAWMCGEMGKRVLAVDLDPQANLTTMFLPEEHLQSIWPEEGPNQSIQECVRPIIDGVGDIADAKLQEISPSIGLLPGDLGLSIFEDKLSDGWPRCLDRDQAAFRAVTAFYRIIHRAAEAFVADVVLMDVGPNLGAINRSSLISCDHVVVPLAPGLFSLQGLKNLGPTLQAWRRQWKARLREKPASLDEPMPSGAMEPAGYVVMQHVERRSRPIRAYQRWISRIPKVYRNHVLDQELPAGAEEMEPEADPYCIGFIKNYQSLMPLAEDARKPIFKLTAADGAIGAHAAAVTRCYGDFEHLTKRILEKTA